VALSLAIAKKAIGIKNATGRLHGFSMVHP
jgi:hypothetical protein